MFDADGSSLGTYRKSHIPDSPGYHEKWHFAPGDTGFRVFKTRYATIGVGICWDQWFPEAARCMVLLGAEILLYPTAIGSEPQDPTLDTSGKWQRCMQGHAAANLVPVVAANRIGRESGTQSDTSVVFYGSSFITDHTGVILADAGRHQETVLTHSFNLADLHSYRLSWGVFRDRRPDLYHPLISLSGGVNPAPRGGYGGQGRSSSVQFPVSGSTRALSMGKSLPGQVPPLTPSMQISANTALPLVPMSLTHANPHAGQFHISTAGGLAEDTSRKMVAGLETHEASFIGDVKASAQRRPRGRCWSCRAKTTYECKACEPGPVPLCNRTARDCWWKYHAGEVTPFVPNKRGRKRKKLGTDVDDDDDSDPKDPLDPDAAAAAAAAAAVVVGTVPGAVAIVD